MYVRTFCLDRLSGEAVMAVSLACIATTHIHTYKQYDTLNIHVTKHRQESLTLPIYPAIHRHAPVSNHPRIYNPTFIADTYS